MTNPSRSFFAPNGADQVAEVSLDLSKNQTSSFPQDDNTPASPSDSSRAPFLNGNANGGASREDVRMGAKAMKNSNDGGLSGIKALPPILSYCGASIMMTVVNKFAVSGAHFHMNLLVLLIQSVVGVLCVIGAQKLGLITLREWNTRDAKNWAPISTLLVLVIYTGSKALQYLNIPVYTIFKNLTIILIAYGEVIWFGGRVTPLVLSSFILMVLSSIIAAWSDIARVLAIANISIPHTPDSVLGGVTTDPNTGKAVGAFDPLKNDREALQAQISQGSENDVFESIGGYGLLSSGYVWMFANCICSAAYVLTMRKRIKVTGFKDWDTMFYNNLLSIPLLMIMSFIVEDWSSESLRLNFPEDKRTNLLTAIVFSGACAVFIGYTTAWCVRTTSSTTYSMVGALNKLPLALSGMIFFKDPPVTLGSTSAISVGFLAGLVYAYAKNKQAEAARLAASTPATGLDRETGLGGAHSSAAKGVIPMHNMNGRKD
ncbi:GDP-mannose transporter [Violaceomyces palustris]|uniref:GDP-mannose transporter n=1 Tax=Violaceomyces palustris TaxID=1673888 RepID=A0ACD0P303_9BASI|nr:GDP-mannose transporter [Violaceomyces palustris]